MAGVSELAAVILQLALHPNLGFLLKNGFRFIRKISFYPLLLIFAPHVSAEKLPPTLIIHGQKDTTVPYHTVEAYTKAAKKLGNIRELIGYEGQSHGFFNQAKFAETLQAADDFLVSLKYLEAAKK